MMLLVVAKAANAKKWRDCHDANGDNPNDHYIDSEVASGVQSAVPFHWALDKNQPVESDGCEVEETCTGACVQEQTCDVTRGLRRPRPAITRGEQRKGTHWHRQPCQKICRAEADHEDIS